MKRKVVGIVLAMSMVISSFSVGVSAKELGPKEKFLQAQEKTKATLTNETDAIFKNENLKFMNAIMGVEPKNPVAVTPTSNVGVGAVSDYKSLLTEAYQAYSAGKIEEFKSEIKNNPEKRALAEQMAKDYDLDLANINSYSKDQLMSKALEIYSSATPEEKKELASVATIPDTASQSSTTPATTSTPATPATQQATAKPETKAPVDQTEYLSKSIYNYNIDYGTIGLPTNTTTKTNIKFDPSKQTFLGNISMKGLESLDLGILSTNDKFGINIKNATDGYYYINTNTFVNDWNKSQLGATSPMDAVQFSQVKMSVDMYKNLFNIGSYLNLTDISTKINKNFEKIFLPYQDKAIYKNDGEFNIESKRGYLVTDKVTMILQKDVANELIKDLAKFIQTDKDVFNLYSTLYGAASARQIVDLAAKTYASITFNDDVTYSIYLNKSGHIYRNEIKLNYVDPTFQNDVVLDLIYDTKGKDFLLDEINYDVLVYTEQDVTTGFSFGLSGQVVPRKGVSTFDINTNAIELDDAGVPIYTNLVTGKVSYDRTKEADNFSLTLNSNDEAKSVLTILGDVYANAAKGANYNFKSIKNVANGVETNSYLNINIKAIDGSKTALPKTDKKFTDLGLEEFGNLSTKLEKMFN